MDPKKKLILQAVRNNDIEYIRMMADKNVAADFDFYD